MQRSPWLLKSKFPKGVCIPASRSACIRHYFPRHGRQLTDCAGAHHGNLTPPRISPSCPHCSRLWLGRSIIARLLTRVVAKQLASAAFWTDGNRSAPYLAVFYAEIVCTGGLGASSMVAVAPLGAARQRTYPVAGCDRAGPVFFKVQKGKKCPSLL